MRLIDSDKFREWLLRQKRLSKGYTIMMLDETPGVDAVPVVHGRWKATWMSGLDECSNCGFQMDWEDVPDWLLAMPFFSITCPNCGARMDLKEE